MVLEKMEVAEDSLGLSWVEEMAVGVRVVVKTVVKTVVVQTVATVVQKEVATEEDLALVCKD